MSRVLVTGIFIVLTVGTGTAAMGAIVDAVTEGTVRAWTVAGYAALKLAVVAAFSFFVFVREPSRRPARDPLAFVACALAVAAVVMLKAPPASASTQLVVTGEVITLVACAWLLVSVLALGRCFGVLPEVRGLVTAGPYSIVRHPVYLGEFGAAAGLVIAAPTMWNIGVAVVFATAQAVRMRLEEAALTREYPEYVAYASETPRLVPRLRRRPA